MATLRNKSLAAVAREAQNEHPRNGQSRNTSVPKLNQDYITQVSKEIKSRFTGSQEFNRTQGCILGALSQLDEFFLNPKVRPQSGTVPGTFRNTDGENQEPNDDHSQNITRPEIGSSVYRSPHSVDSDPEEALYIGSVVSRLYNCG